MWITHSFVGTTRGRVRCLFFLLFEDYIEAQRGLSGEVRAEIERFARNLGESGAVVAPFAGDAPRTHQHILEKQWSEKERHEVMRTPALLMVDRDFDDFDPRRHSWVLFHFDRAPDHAYAAKLRSLFTKIVEAAGTTSDPFETVRGALRHDSVANASKVIKLEPGAFGISVDLRAAWTTLKDVLRKKSSVANPGDTKETVS